MFQILHNIFKEYSNKNQRTTSKCCIQNYSKTILQKLINKFSHCRVRKIKISLPISCLDVVCALRCFLCINYSSNFLLIILALQILLFFRFLWELAQIPEYAVRVECIMFHASFSENLAQIESKLDNLKLTCEVSIWGIILRLEGL